MDDTHSTAPSHPQREPVLVLCHADGWTEVYAPRHIDVVCANVPMTSTIAGELAAEEYIEASVPLRYRDLLWPDLRRATHLWRIVTPEDLAATQLRLDLLAAIREVGGA